MNKVELAQDELLREAKKAGNQICRLSDGNGHFVKARRGYSYPDEVRDLYNQAMDGLLNAGKLRCVIKNHALELYEVLATNGAVMNKRSAKRLLLQYAEQYGHIYKIHSKEGEFVQAGPNAFFEVDEERILVMAALVELAREGRLRVVNDSKELTNYESSQPTFPRVFDDYDDSEATTEVSDNLYPIINREPPAQELPKSA